MYIYIHIIKHFLLTEIKECRNIAKQFYQKSLLSFKSELIRFRLTTKMVFKNRIFHTLFSKSFNYSGSSTLSSKYSRQDSLFSRHSRPKSFESEPKMPSLCERFSIHSGMSGGGVSPRLPP